MCTKCIVGARGYQKRASNTRGLELDNCEMPYGFWKLNPVPMQEKQALIDVSQPPVPDVSILETIFRFKNPNNVFSLRITLRLLLVCLLASVIRMEERINKLAVLPSPNFPGNGHLHTEIRNRNAHTSIVSQ